MKNCVIDSILEAARLDTGGPPTTCPLTDYEQLPEVDAAYNALSGATTEEVQGMICSLYDACEAQGFRNGLKYGVRLAMELGLTGQGRRDAGRHEM